MLSSWIPYFRIHSPFGWKRIKNGACFLECRVVTTLYGRCCTQIPLKVAFQRMTAPRWFHRILIDCFAGSKGEEWLFSQFSLRNYVINFKQICLLHDSWKIYLLMGNWEYSRGWLNMQHFLNPLGQVALFWKNPWKTCFTRLSPVAPSILSPSLFYYCQL